MTRRRLQKIFLGFVLVGILLVWATPYLLQVERVQQRLDQALEQCYQVDIEASNIHFSWLPRPHISLGTTTLKNSSFQATIADIAIYPALKLPWLQQGASIARISIKKPHFTVIKGLENSTHNQDSLAFFAALPASTIVINDGRLNLPGFTWQGYDIAPQKIIGISTTWRQGKDKIRFTWQSLAALTGKLNITGYISKAGGGEAKLQFQEFSLASLGQFPPDAFIQPGKQNCNFTINAFWQKRQGDLQFTGQLPDFYILRQGVREHIVSQSADFRLRNATDELSLKIKELQLTTPSATLFGEVGRFGPGPDPDFLVDLHGKDIDLKGVRAKLLNLLGDSPIVQRVCDIVRHGTARTAHYYFKDPSRYFSYISAMTIQVGVENAWIHLAELPLDLHQASGPIIIKDGVLTGKDITTSVENSHGQDGSFLVGLADNKHGLKVDVLIDADLSELPQTLRQLIKNKTVTDELTLVEGSGRAIGRLQIDGTLADFKTSVEVQKYKQAKVSYNRLSWPMLINKGLLLVTESSATWQGVAAQVGPQQIQESSGHIAWDRPNIPFAITSLQGQIDLNTMYNELTLHPVLHNFLTPVVSSIQGSAEVDGELGGNFFHPDSWVYKTKFALHDTIFSSPYFKEDTRLEMAQASISDKHLGLQTDDATILTKSYKLQIEVNHQLWQNFSGTMLFAGWLEKPQISWFQTHHLLPLQPNIRSPAHLSDFHISWNNDKITLQGELNNKRHSSKALIDIALENNLTSGSITLANGEESAVLTGMANPHKKIYDVHFKGRLREKTLDDLILNKPFNFTSASGDFHLNTWPDPNNGKQQCLFKGNLNSSGVGLLWGQEKIPLTIQSLAVQGKGRSLALDTLALRFKDAALLGRGEFITGPGTGHFKLKINSGSLLTSTMAEKFIDGYLWHFPEKNKGRKTVMDLSGDITFNLAHFTAPLGQEKAGGKKPILPFAPLNGHYSFAPHKSSLTLQDTQLCGMFVDGRWNWQGALKTDKYLHFQAKKAHPLNFKDFLTCLNFDAVVDGPLEIQGEISTAKDICKQGIITLKSRNGTIKKMVPLAKVLSIINITGLTGAIWHTGFYYHSFEITGTMCDNVFVVNKAFIDGDGVNIVAQGLIDFSKQEYDLTFFVVPFSTINTIVTTVPLVGRLLGGRQKRLISVPVRLSGSFTDPQVQVLSASAVTKATAQWILDTIVLPFDWAIPTEKPPTTLKLPPESTIAPN